MPEENGEVSGKRYWTARRKAEIVLEGLKENQTVAEICRKYGITQSMYYEWKQTFIAKGEEGLTYGGKSRLEYEQQKEIAKLQRKIGELTMDIEILKKVQTDNSGLQQRHSIPLKERVSQ